MLTTLFIAWLASTTCMTAFSYLFTIMLKENFKEPQLLSQLMGAVFNRDLPLWMGWLAHYMTGILFLGLLILCYLTTDVPVDFGWGILFGIAMGCIGILMWKGLYKVANTKPPTQVKFFHLQLLVAHVFFSLAAVAVGKMWTPYLKLGG